MAILLDQPRPLDEITASFSRFYYVDIRDLLDLEIQAGWIEMDVEGFLILSREGKEILRMPSPQHRLRAQISRLLQMKSPPWKPTMYQGRLTFTEYAPVNVVQCFREAGLLSECDEDSIEFWDKLIHDNRQNRDIEKKRTGRIGERLSFEYETRRIGSPPDWISLDIESAGYDLLSKCSKESDERLLIEVKASTLPLGQAEFYISRHEWEVLSGAPYSTLHLWSLYDRTVKFAEVAISQLHSHVPVDQGSGKWQSMTCRFCVFEFLDSGTAIEEAN